MKPLSLPAMTSMRITSMMLSSVILVLLAANGVSAATVASLQSEGDAIYDMSQAMPSLVTRYGTSSHKAFDLMA